MSVLDTTQLAAALKTIYTVFKVEDLVYANNPLLAMIAKNEKFEGDYLKMPIIYGNPQGRSASFSTASTNKTSSKLKAFLLSRVSDYARASVSNEAIMAAGSDAGAFLRAHTLEIDGAMNALGRSIAVALYRAGTGRIGKVVSTQSGGSTTISLANTEDAVNIEVGMALVSSDNDGGGTASSTQYYVLTVDRAAGTFTASATETGSAATATTMAFTANKYLFVQGDYDAKIKGLQAWIPSSVTPSESFFNVDRSADRQRLAGYYVDKSSMPIDEALIDAASELARIGGGSPDTIFMNNKDYRNLVKILGSKVQYTNVTGGEDARFSFQGVALNGDNGVLKVVPDRNCPVGESFILQMDTWKLCSLGKAPSLFRGDGLEMIRSTSADNVDFQCFFYGNVGCNAPGWNGRVLVGG